VSIDEGVLHRQPPRRAYHQLSAARVSDSLSAIRVYVEVERRSAGWLGGQDLGFEAVPKETNPRPTTVCSGTPIGHLNSCKNGG